MSKAALKPELKFGAEPKKLIILGVLLAVAAIAYFISSSDSSGGQSTAATAVRPAPGRISPAVPVAGPNARPGGPRVPARGASKLNIVQKSGGTSMQEFRPTLKPKEALDPAHVDPTLRLELLAKLRSVSIEGGHRSLFDFSGAPAPEGPKVATPKVKPIIPGAVQTARAFVGPVEEKPAPPPPKPPPTPIPLKFYGFTNAAKAGQGPKRAFFLEGDDIFVAGEGELIKNRYRVVRIGVNSAVVEDVNQKHQQTLPLEAEQVNT